MNYKWVALFLLSLTILFGVLTTVTEYSEFAGFLAFSFIVAIIPYTIYKSLSKNYKLLRLSLIIAFASPVLLGMSWSKWVQFLIRRQLEKEGILTTGIVVAAWQEPTRHGGQQKLFKVRFRSNSGIHQTASYPNNWNYKTGDSIGVKYSFANPAIHLIVNPQE